MVSSIQVCTESSRQISLARLAFAGARAFSNCLKSPATLRWSPFSRAIASGALRLVLRLGFGTADSGKEAWTRNAGHRFPLFRLHARVANDLAPFRHLLADVHAELLGRAADGLHALRRKLLAHVGHREDLLHLGVELVHHLARRAGGCHQAEP